MTDKTEITLRAVVEGKNLGRVKLPDAITLSTGEAHAFAAWARAFAGICLSEIDVLVSDVRPSAGLKVMADLDPRLVKQIKPLFDAANVYGFALRLDREDAGAPFELSIVRRVVDAPQLTLSHKSMTNFMEALGLVETIDATIDRKLDVASFTDLLKRRKKDCMDAGVGHYAAYANRILEYAIDNGATDLIWGPERRGAVEAPAEHDREKPALAA